MNTGSCVSEITFIDGEKGILRYRGFPIEELAEKVTFIQTAYLLLHGDLPDEEQMKSFSGLLNKYSLIHEDMRHFFDGFPRAPTDAHPLHDDKHALDLLPERRLLSLRRTSTPRRRGSSP
jgi:citrate synthase